MQKVSIVIPVFNRVEVIERTIFSALNQTHENIEIVVVDNNSNDGTYEKVKQISCLYPNVKVYTNDSNIGPVKNWLRCIKLSSGQFVKILWSDDLIAPDYIEKTLPFLVDFGDVGFVFSGTEIFNDLTGARIKSYFIGETGLYSTREFIESSLLGRSLAVPVSPGNALFRKKDLEKNLLVNIPNRIGSDFASHAIGNDVLIYLLTANDYIKFAFVNESLSFFREHPDSISTSSNHMKLLVLYHVAKAYFVETCVHDFALKRKFNTKLFIVAVRNFFSKNMRRFIVLRGFIIKKRFAKSIFSISRSC